MHPNNSVVADKGLFSDWYVWSPRPLCRQEGRLYFGSLPWTVFMSSSCGGTCFFGLGPTGFSLVSQMLLPASFAFCKMCSMRTLLLWNMLSLGMQAVVHGASLDSWYIFHCWYRIHSLPRFSSQELHVNFSLSLPQACVWSAISNQLLIGWWSWLCRVHWLHLGGSPSDLLDAVQEL